MVECPNCKAAWETTRASDKARIKAEKKLEALENEMRMRDTDKERT